jgi:hypothetical protein
MLVSHIWCLPTGRTPVAGGVITERCGTALDRVMGTLKGVKGGRGYNRDTGQHLPPSTSTTKRDRLLVNSKVTINPTNIENKIPEQQVVFFANTSWKGVLIIWKKKGARRHVQWRKRHVLLPTWSDTSPRSLSLLSLLLPYRYRL